MKKHDDYAASHIAPEPPRTSPEEGQCRHARQPGGPHRPSPEESLNLSHQLVREYLYQLIDGKVELRDLPHRLRKDHQALAHTSASTSPVDEAQFPRCEIMVLRAIIEMLLSIIRLLPRFLLTILADFACKGSASRASPAEPNAKSGKPGFCGPSVAGWEPA